MMRKAARLRMSEGQTLAARCRVLAETGFEGIDVALPADIDVTELADASAQAGVEVANVLAARSLHSMLADADPTVRRDGLVGLELSLQGAAALGATSVLLPALLPANADEIAARTNTAHELRQVLPLAEELDVRVAVESCPEGFLLSSEALAEFVDEFDSSHVTVHFDVGNAQALGRLCSGSGAWESASTRWTSKTSAALGPRRRGSTTGRRSGSERETATGLLLSQPSERSTTPAGSRPSSPDRGGAPRGHLCSDGHDARMTSVRIGVIGCGRIAQVMHLPFLDELPQFELVALSDLSADVLSGLGRRYRAESTTDYTELLERVDIEAVAITTPDHAAIAEQAARAGKHVFVEKPLCFTPAEGQRIADAVHDAGVRLMVGYMRRFDPAVMRLHELLPEVGQIRVVRARDMLGLRSVPTDIYTMTMPTEGSAGSVSNRAPFQSRLAEGVGSDDPRRVNLYWVMLMLGIHHLAVLRALLGEPAEVQGTELLGEQHLVTTLLYEDGERALLLGVWPVQTWTETSLDVVTDTSVVSLSFPNPWVRSFRRPLCGDRRRTTGPSRHTTRTRIDPPSARNGLPSTN